MLAAARGVAASGAAPAATGLQDRHFDARLPLPCGKGVYLAVDLPLPLEIQPLLDASQILYLTKIRATHYRCGVERRRVEIPRHG
jgi:hypothetical protein